VPARRWPPHHFVAHRLALRPLRLPYLYYETHHCVNRNRTHIMIGLSDAFLPSLFLLIRADGAHPSIEKFLMI
jgi:hypothetical protein